MPRPPKATRDDLINDTRRRLLDAAAAEFACEGYVGANINRISTAAGFAKGTIYNYFASKRALIETVINDTAEEHITAIRAHIDPDASAEQQLEGFFTGGFAFVNAHPDPSRVVINALYGPDPDLKQQVYDAYQPLFDLLIHDIMSSGMAQGEFRNGDADMAAALIMTIYLGSCSLLNPDGTIVLQPAQVTTFILDGLHARQE